MIFLPESTRGGFPFNLRSSVVLCNLLLIVSVERIEKQNHEVVSET